MGRLAVVGFVLWHAFAVLVYSVPRVAADPISTWTRRHLVPVVGPYMFLTSQWQLWDMFAPDPTRLVSAYRIEVEAGDRWRELTTVEPGTYSIWRHAARFKLFGNVLRDGVPVNRPAAERFLQLICAERNVPAGTAIRLTYLHYLIPAHARRESRAWWRAWRPLPVLRPATRTSCP